MQSSGRASALFAVFFEAKAYEGRCLTGLPRAVLHRRSTGRELKAKADDAGEGIVFKEGARVDWCY